MFMSMPHLADLVMYLVRKISHIGFMSPNPNKIAEIRRRKKLTQQQLAERLGVHTITVSKLERGVMQLTSSWIERLAKAMEVAQSELWMITDLMRFEANGQVSDGDRVQVVDPSENGFSTFRHPLGDPTSKWLHVQDDSLLPFAGEGDLLQFSLLQMDEIEKSDLLNGRLCMYVLEGTEEIRLAIREKWHSDRLLDLRSMNGRLMKNCRVEAVWYFSGYQPNWGVVAHFDTDRKNNVAMAERVG